MIETIVHDGQVIKLDTPKDGTLWIIRPHGGKLAEPLTLSIGPFRAQERDLALDVAACHFSFGQPCIHGHTYVDGDRCEDCDEATAGDIRYHAMKDDPERFDR